MTVLELTLAIALAILMQVAGLCAVAFARHWRTYQELKDGLAGYAAARPGMFPKPLPAMPAGAADAPAWEGFREFRVVDKTFANGDRSVCALHLEPADGTAPPAFAPGQFLTFRFDIADPASGRTGPAVRCYSLSDHPESGTYRVLVKRAADGLVSRHVHDVVQVGNVLMIQAPRGHFVLDGDGAPVVLIAGGIGITPMLSMLTAACENGDGREIWLFHGSRNGADHVMKDHLETLAADHPNLHLRVCYSRPRPDDVPGRDYQHRGRIDIALLRQTLPLKPYRFHVCGPRALMETLIPALRGWGVPDDNIRYEAFGPVVLSLRARQFPADGAPSGPIAVTFAGSQKTVTWDGTDASLLDFAERNGIEVTSGCRAGGCGSCQTTIEDGEVDYLIAPDFDPEPGRCLLCVSYPKRDLILTA